MSCLSSATAFFFAVSGQCCGCCYTDGPQLFPCRQQDTQYPEYKNPPAMPARSLCPFVSIPLTSPLANPAAQASCSAKTTQCTARVCHSSGRSCFIADTKCGAPAVVEPVVPEDADLGLIKDTVDIEGNQTSCDQQQLRSSAEAPMPIQCLCLMLHHVGRAMPKIYRKVSSWLTPQSLNQSLQSRRAQAVRLSCLTHCHLPHPFLLALLCCLSSSHRQEGAVHSVATNILTAAEQFELQAAFAYVAAFAKQTPVPRGLLVHNLTRANALLPAGWQARGLEEGHCTFVTQFVVTRLLHILIAQQELIRMWLHHPGVKDTGSLNNSRWSVSHSLCWIGGAKTSVQ